MALLPNQGRAIYHPPATQKASSSEAISRVRYQTLLLPERPGEAIPQRLGDVAEEGPLADLEMGLHRHTGVGAPAVWRARWPQPQAAMRSSAGSGQSPGVRPPESGSGPPRRGLPLAAGRRQR